MSMIIKEIVLITQIKNAQDSMSNWIYRRMPILTNISSTYIATLIFDKFIGNWFIEMRPKKKAFSWKRNPQNGKRRAKSFDENDSIVCST